MVLSIDGTDARYEAQLARTDGSAELSATALRHPNLWACSQWARIAIGPTSTSTSNPTDIGYVSWTLEIIGDVTGEGRALREDEVGAELEVKVLK